MHTLVWHVSEFIQLYNSISSFIQQGLDTLNDKTTKDYFRSTNQRRLDSLKQIVSKRNRMEYSEDIGCQRDTRGLSLVIVNNRVIIIRTACPNAVHVYLSHVVLHCMCSNQMAMG